MASRAIPPHQDISAPRTVSRPLMISAGASSTGTRSSPNARAAVTRFIGFLRERSDEVSGRCFRPLQSGTVVLFQFRVRVDDRGELLDDGGELPAGQDAVEFVVAEVGVNAVADAAQAGD